MACSILFLFFFFFFLVFGHCNGDPIKHGIQCVHDQCAIAYVYCVGPGLSLNTKNKLCSQISLRVFPHGSIDVRLSIEGDGNF